MQRSRQHRYFLSQKQNMIKFTKIQYRLSTVIFFCKNRQGMRTTAMWAKRLHFSLSAAPALASGSFIPSRSIFCVRPRDTMRVCEQTTTGHLKKTKSQTRYHRKNNLFLSHSLASYYIL